MLATVTKINCDLSAPRSCVFQQVNLPQFKFTQIIVNCFDECWDLCPSSAFPEVGSLLGSPAQTRDSNKHLCRSNKIF